MHALQTRGLLFIRLTEFRPCSGATHSLALPPCQAAPYPPLCSAAHLLAAHPAHTITQSIVTEALLRIFDNALPVFRHSGLHPKASYSEYSEQCHAPAHP